MKNQSCILLLLGLALSGCGQKETPAPVVAPKAPPVAAPAMPSLTSPPAAPPPPGAAPAAAAASATVAQIPTYEGKDEAEKLTAALHDYYARNGAEAPIVTSFEALVKARVLKSVPVPPPGKKYVIDAKNFQVRLENK